jgi:hypothetical protein
MRPQPNPRPTPPRLSQIAAAWAKHPDIEAVLPELRALWIGWGEPFCFRCGWLAPVKDGAWDDAGGWLERAHLHDHDHGGSSDPLNLVPLCPLCHELQPECRSREAGIAFVRSLAEHASLLEIAQVITDHDYRGVRHPGKQRALRGLLRAHAKAGRLYAEAMRGEIG